MQRVEVLMRFPKLAICGPGRSGKDTAASWLAAHTRLRLGKSTSQVIAPFVASRLGIPIEDAFRRRHEDRGYWFNLGNELRARARDQTVLVREAIKGADIVQGLRNYDEVIASRNERLVDLFLWIERAVPPDPTMKFGPDQCDVVVRNNGTLGELFDKLEAIARFSNILL
jgi:hypothetical protein